MQNWIDYLFEEEGYRTIVKDYGFCSYKIIGEEFFCGHLFINKENRGKGLEFASTLERFAKDNGCKCLTGNIWFDGNDEKYIRKLRLFNSLGFKILKMDNNVTTLIKEIAL